MSYTAHLLFSPEEMCIRDRFAWRQIPKMMELKALQASIEERPAMPAAERGDLLGECDLIMSFLCYNDIDVYKRQA